MLFQYANVLFGLIFGALFVVLNISVLNRILAPKVKDAAKESIYECGEPAIGSAWVRFDMRFYTVALVFLVFEVEARRLAVCAFPPTAALEKKWRRALGHLDALIADCRRRGVPVGLVLIPDEFQVNGEVLAVAAAVAGLDSEKIDLEYPQWRLWAFCAERGVPCLDLLPVLRGRADAYAPRDTHWNATGNRLAAAEVAAWLPEISPRMRARLGP